MEKERELYEYWDKLQVHKFNPASKKPIFTINTPPPYPSGDPHPGYVLNWGFIDFIARYKRMRGFSVMFPQGWDVHGLPTEVKVENWKGKKSSQVPREEWVKWCNEWTAKYIDITRDVLKQLGCSIDWNYEYTTDDPEYKKHVQLTFLRAYEDGYAYRGKHPVNWCTHCGTAIATAEVEHEDRKAKLFEIKFELAGKNGDIIIATTRPELLPACGGIAVHPSDERYSEIIGRRAIVPIFGQEVEIFASEDVDKEFGTGLVMICTFGDKQDVIWAYKHNLPIVDAINEYGRMTDVARVYKGLNTMQAKKAIVEDLQKIGILLSEKELAQVVGVCWRCKNAIEILNQEQWFMRAVQFKEDVIKATKQVKWWPEFMVQRQIDWASSQTWDWVVSRQKVFGTPIPIWYCDKCNEMIPAEEKDLPVDPVGRDKPCNKCGGKTRGETDTLDTWMDSSVSNYYHAGWPKSGWEKFVPASLQPNGHEIIRTWDYYLMLRSLMLTGKLPYENVLINGWVLAEDGKKMSKSLGNFVTINKLLETIPSDSLRYWASRSTPGSDYPFSSKDIQHAGKFLNKLRNIGNFLKMIEETIPFLERKGLVITPKERSDRRSKINQKPEMLNAADRWILSKMQKTIKESTEAMENYMFPITIIEQFIWHEVADFYLEMIKYRVYEAGANGRAEEPSSRPNTSGNLNSEAALWTLRHVLLTSLKLLAPFVPYVTEEIYQDIYTKNKDSESIHATEWPEAEKELEDKTAENAGEMVKDVISAVRKWKNEKKLSQNAPFAELIIDKITLKQFDEDLKGTLKCQKVSFANVDDIKTDIFGIGIRIVE